LHRWERRYQRGDLADGDEGAVAGRSLQGRAVLVAPSEKEMSQTVGEGRRSGGSETNGRAGRRRHRVMNPPTVLLHAHGAPNLLLQKKWIIQREKGEEEKNGDEEMRGSSLALHGASGRRPSRGHGPSVRGRRRRRGGGGKGLEQEGVATMGVPSVAARVLLGLGFCLIYAGPVHARWPRKRVYRGALPDKSMSNRPHISLLRISLLFRPVSKNCSILSHSI
jgi:hypothetical protein